ncbi:MAG: ABC transporter permease [Chloroflexi bacterium RBG_16_56_11]|nr:MAG: ABC transporter permease [Chloroflexi bacterium RBG_16_56_11]
MAERNIAITEFAEIPPRVSEWRRFRRVFFSRGVVVFGIIVLLLLLFTAIFAAWLAPYDPYKPIPVDSLAQPGTKHLLGADLLGRDTLSRLIYGSRTALMVGFISVGVASIVGISLGIIAGYSGGLVNVIIMRAMDALMCFPMLLLSLVIAAVLGNGIQNVIIALSVATIPGYARVTHGVTLSIRENDYIMAQWAIGSSNLRTMLRHILPNAFPPLIVLMTMQLGNLILAEAGLSFLGIGIEPPGAAWGAMVNDGYRYLLRSPILSFAPGLAIMLVVFAFNMVGDGLRDALDPRLRGLL